jgi:Dyp-type peroxidase family
VPNITTATLKPDKSALNVAFTSSGLAQLGLGTQALAGFSQEFLDGMAAPHRSRMFGDVDESAPQQWAWGGPSASIDALLLAFATDWNELDCLLDAQTSRLAGAGLEQVARLDTVDLGNVEHFGFRDGISQPAIEGVPVTAPTANTIKTGEFVLGYPNEYGLYTDRPLLERSADPGEILPADPQRSGRVDLGRNGTYLVFRQLQQDVRGFWRFLDAATKRPYGSSNSDSRISLGARMVGRWPGGAPLALSSDKDDATLAKANDFGYFQLDAAGNRCPIGAHVRRANPRDSLDPNPGSAESIAIGKRHRIIRRGREYGPPVPPDQLLAEVSEAEERGIHFICLNANIARQFEFIQHTWVANPKFDGLYQDDDPLLGAHGEGAGRFTVQAKPVRRRISHLGRFVTVRGGAYFFLPGIRAMRFLSTQKLGG